MVSFTDYYTSTIAKRGYEAQLANDGVRRVCFDALYRNTLLNEPMYSSEVNFVLLRLLGVEGGVKLKLPYSESFQCRNNI